RRRRFDRGCGSGVRGRVAFRGMTPYPHSFYRRPMKKLLLAVLAIAFTFGATLAQGEGASDETRMTLRGEFVRLINRDRAKFGLAPVQLDAQVSVTADA